MKKIGFRSTDAMKTYMDRPVWSDGDIREVADGVAEHLCETFPLNFMPAGKMKAQLQSEKAAEKKAAEDESISAPAGHPDAHSIAQIGDTTGTETGDLTDVEIELVKSAAAKIDKGESLTPEEQAAFDKSEGE